MTSLREQTDKKIADGRSKKPEFMKSVDDAIAKAKQFNEGKNALELGSIAPSFELPNANNQPVVLSDLLKDGPAVITFYRGSWCPYCNLQLRALQSVLDEIHQLGAKLIAISPEVPDGSMSKSEIQKLNFTVLSDQDSRVGKKFGVAWTVPEVLQEHMKVDRQLDLAKINNGDGTILPIPATFVLNKEGKVIWRFVDVDYRKRSEPSDIIKALKDIS